MFKSFAQGEACRRSWCMLEMATAIGVVRGHADGPACLDLAVCVGSRAAVLTDGLTDVEQDWEALHPGMGHIGKTEREKKFPLEVLAVGLSLDLRTCRASLLAERTAVSAELGDESHGLPSCLVMSWDVLHGRLKV